jgi:tetratricopeptide (TPR) repeat protein
MRIYILLLLILLPFVPDAQESSESIWEKANAFYTTGEYEKAISSYEQILNEGQVSAKLYYNLGNAYYKAGDVNNAILNYERAKLLAPQDEDIQFNLQLANQYVITKIEELPKPFFLRWKTNVINLYPADTWSSISIAAFVIFLGLLGLFLFSRIAGIKRLSFWFGILLILISGFTFSFASEQKKNLLTRDQAIVFCPRVTVKSSPAKTGTDLFLLYEGVKVQITDSLNTWKEIRLDDGNEGWLPDSCMVKI